MGEVQSFQVLGAPLSHGGAFEAEAVANKGFRGCIHGRPESKRQISLMDLETLEKLGVAPGLVKENITTRSVDFQALSTGQILRIGEECVLEIKRSVPSLSADG